MISEIVTLMSGRKSCQPRMHPRHWSFGRDGNLDTRGALGGVMNFFWEQIREVRCLNACLSGNGQESLNALVPAPGGDQ